MTEKTKTIEKIASAYEDNPVIRALIQLALAPIPYGIGSAIDDALTTAIGNLREKRLRIFFDELASGEKYLTQEKIQSEPFLHAYFSTLKAAINSHRNEKIILFARLLSNSTKMNALDTDDFEDFLSILESLSVRELYILLILESIEKKHHFPIHKYISDGDDLAENVKHTSQYWSKFEHTVEEKCGIDSLELRAILTRLNRTGLYETYIGSVLDYTGYKGKLTTLYFKFIKWLNVKKEELETLSAA